MIRYRKNSFRCIKVKDGFLHLCCSMISNRLGGTGNEWMKEWIKKIHSIHNSLDLSAHKEKHQTSIEGTFCWIWGQNTLKLVLVYDWQQGPWVQLNQSLEAQFEWYVNSPQRLHSDFRTNWRLMKQEVFNQASHAWAWGSHKRYSYKHREQAGIMVIEAYKFQLAMTS